MDANGLVDFKDFEEREEPHYFRVGTEQFSAVPSLGIATMARLGKMQVQLTSLGAGQNTNVEQVIVMMITIFDELLLEDSAERFRTRLTSKDRPMSFTTVVNIINWLLECYGLRPTLPSSSSSSSPAASTSTSSTPGQQVMPLETGLVEVPLPGAS